MWEGKEKENEKSPIRQEPYKKEFIMNDLDRKWIENDNYIEFGNNLKEEFNSFLLENKPLDKEFLPKKELELIKKMPKNEKRRALDEFKDKLERQREGWANCRVFIERIIDFDNNPPRDYLLEWVHLFGKEYGFTEDHYELTGKIIDTFYEERKECENFLEEFKKPHQAVNDLIGAKFKNSKGIEVRLGPISVDVVVDPKKYKKIIKNKNINVSSSSDGFSSAGLFAGIYYNVIKKIKNEDEIEIHEREHSKNNLLFSFFHPEQSVLPVKRLCLEKRLKEERNEEKKEKLFKKYLKAIQEEGLLGAKQEIIAYKKDGSNPTSSIFFEFPSYDYFKNIREEYIGEPERSVVNKILVEDYKNILDHAITAFNVLEKKGYTTDQVISLLGDKKLSKWFKTALRIIRQRR